MSYTELQLQEVSAMRAVSGDSFSQGLIEFPFSIGRPNAFVPSKTYFRIGLTLTGNDGTQPTVGQQLAFADNAAGNLFNNVYFRAGGQDVSSLVSYVPQAGQIRNRISKTGAWLNTIGKSAYMQNPSFSDRLALTSIGAPNPTDTTPIDLTLGAAATVAINALGVVTGVDLVFPAAGFVGATLVVNGVSYTITARTTGTSCQVSPIPAFAVAATTNFYAFQNNNSFTENGKNTIYIIYRPGIGIMDTEEALGAGDYRFSLNPNADFSKSCVQSIVDKTVGIAALNNFKVVVTDMKLYVAVAKMSIPDQVQNLYLMETDIQSKTITPSQSSLQFTIPPSTRYVSIFFQANVAGSNTIFPPSLFKTSGSQEQQLQSLQITYANITKPSTRWDSLFGGTNNQYQQRYVDNLRESNLLDSVGGAETFEEFLERGVYFHYSFARDESDKSTQCQVSTAFQSSVGADFTIPTKVFIASHYTRAVEITTANGLITAVRSLTV